MEDRQLLLAKQDYAGKKIPEVLLVVDVTKSFTITAVGEVLARLDKLICYVPATSLIYDILAGEVPRIPPASDVWLMIGTTNIGTIAGNLFYKVTDLDTGTVLLEKTIYRDVGAYGEGAWSIGVMPTHDWRILVEIRH